MNTDIRISVEFWDHPKTVKLERRLGLEAIKHLQILWVWTAKNKPDGFLEGFDQEDIEIASKWCKEAGVFSQTLVDLKWIEKQTNGYLIHDWKDHNAWAADADIRGDKARFSRLAKTHPEAYEMLRSGGIHSISKENYEKMIKNSDRSTFVNASLTPAPAPAPAPSPSPTNKNLTTEVSIN